MRSGGTGDASGEASTASHATVPPNVIEPVSLSILPWRQRLSCFEVVELITIEPVRIDVSLENCRVFELLPIWWSAAKQITAINAAVSPPATTSDPRRSRSAAAENS